MKLSSKLLEDAVAAFSSLPGIGKRSALRMVLHLLHQDKEFTDNFAGAVARMRQHIRYCATCHYVGDHDQCDICADLRRDHSVVCIVEGIRDVMAIEETGQYRGLYHILGGVISPIEGVGPGDLNIDTLLARISTGEIKEVIMAVSPTIEGETTIFYLSKRLADLNVQVSTIARGVSFGGELEYADEVTLGRSIIARIPYRVSSD